MTNLQVKMGQSYRSATREEILNAAAKFAVEETRGKELTPANAVDFLRPLTAGYDREQAVFAFLNPDGTVIDITTLFQGTITQTPLFIREVVRRALELNAFAVVAAHNHPNGKEAIPSDADIRGTRSLKEALELLEMNLLASYVITNTDSALIPTPSHDDPSELLRRIFGPQE